jgi:hypothetical protein
MTEINEADELLRRIHPYHIVMDQKLGRERPASAAFENTTGTDCMSVDLNKLLNCPEDCVKDYSGCSIAIFEVVIAYELNQGVKGSPQPENPAHCDVIGKKTESVKKKFAVKSQLLKLSA